MNNDYSCWKRNDLNDDPPTIIDDSGTKYWYKEGQLHRDNDQPAVIKADGTKYWFQNGLRRRSNNQPDVIYADEVKKWRNRIEHPTQYVNINANISELNENKLLPHMVKD